MASTEFQAASKQVLALLTCTHDPAQVTQASQQLDGLQGQPGFGVVLAALLANREVPTQLRQTAGVHLKLLINKRWNENARLYEEKLGSVVPEVDREQIKELLAVPSLIAESDSKVQTAACMSIGAIARLDYPERWPGLLEKVVQFMTGENGTLRAGSLRVLVLLSESIEVKQLDSVLPVLFPILVQVAGDTEHFTMSMRADAILVYSKLLATLGVVKDKQQKLKALLRPTLLNMLSAFVSIFQHGTQYLSNGPIQDEEKAQELYSLLQQAICCLIHLLAEFPQTIKNQLPQVLQAFWQCVLACRPVFESLYVHVTAESATESAGLEEMGSSISLASVVDQAFSLLCQLANTNMKSIRDLLKGIIKDAATVSLSFAQMTWETVSLWEDEPTKFVEAEDETEFDEWTVRLASKKLLTHLVTEYGSVAGHAIVESCTAALAASEQARSQNNPFWWKMRESAELAMGIVGALTEEAVWKASPVFDVSEFTEKVLLPDLNPQSSNFFLRSRALWCLSQLMKYLPPSIQSRLVGVVADNLPPALPIPVRMAASRAFGIVCQDLDKEIIRPSLPSALANLMQLVTESSEHTLYLSLCALMFGLEMDADVSAEVEPIIIPMLLKTWSEHANDPTTSDCVVEIVETMCGIPKCVPSVQEKITPVVMHILRNQDKSFESGTQETAMNLLKMLIHAHQDAVPAVFVSQCLPVIVLTVLNTDDHGLLEVGSATLAAFLRAAHDQVHSVSVDGKPMLSYVAQVLQRVLDPSLSDTAALSAGDLVHQMLCKAKDFLGAEGMSQVLLAVVKRLASAKSTLLKQGLVLVFARMVHAYGANQVLDFLTQAGEITMDSQPISCLEFVMRTWTESLGDIQSKYHVKVSLMALLKILSTKDPRMAGVNTKGYVHVNADGPRCTRSQAKEGLPLALSMTTMQLPSKVLSLAVCQWNSEREAREMQELDGDNSAHSSDLDEDEADAFWADGLASGAQGNLIQAPPEDYLPNNYVEATEMREIIQLSDLLDGDMGILDEDLFEEDPEAKKDPLNEIDLEASVWDYVHGMATSEPQLLSSLAQPLSSEEQAQLQGLIHSERPKVPQ